jgi:hypothetical protein
MVAFVWEFSSFAGGANGVLCPAQEHRDLSHVEWSGTALEHLWNKTAVHGCEPLVILALLWQ